MTPEQQMLAAVTRSLRALGSTAPQISLVQYKGYIYTAYIASLIADALKRVQGVRVSIAQTRTGRFDYPLGPSRIYSRGASYYIIKTRTTTYEMHLCCKCNGRSGTEHELDIVILPKDVADQCRSSWGVNPKTDQVIFLVECKNVGAIELSVGREFLGLSSEFPFRPKPKRVGTRRRATERAKNGMGAFVATLTSIGDMPTAFQLVKKRKLLAVPFLEPGKPSTEQDFQFAVRSTLKPFLT